MPRKQRFKPTRKPKPTSESAAIERTQDPPSRPSGEEALMSSQPPNDEERRSE